MANHKNFYETIKEARMRLQHTVVMYDGEPYYILCISDHKPDGIYRVYMDKLGQAGGLTHTRIGGVPYEDYGEGDLGANMDKWLDYNPKSGIVRKMANSPKFNKYRPFPLGMINHEKTGEVYYARRGPTRHTQQGLTETMFNTKPVNLVDPVKVPRGMKHGVGFTSNGAYLCYKGEYPSFTEVLQNLTDPETANNAAAFHREFALLRGPLDMLFLAYREDVIGFVPDGSPERVKIARGFSHCREVVQELGVFNNVEVQE